MRKEENDENQSSTFFRRTVLRILSYSMKFQFCFASSLCTSFSLFSPSLSLSFYLLSVNFSPVSNFISRQGARERERKREKKGRRGKRSPENLTSFPFLTHPFHDSIFLTLSLSFWQCKFGKEKLGETTTETESDTNNNSKQTETVWNVLASSNSPNNKP